MKRIIFLLSMLIVLAFVVVSCDDGSGSPDVPDIPEESNPLVGEWYALYSTNFEGSKVIFTETNITAIYYGPLEIMPFHYRHNIYNVLSDNKIQITGITGPLDHIWSHDGEHITEFAFINDDTLVIDRFIPNFTDMPYPFNLDEVRLYRDELGITREKNSLIGHWYRIGSTTSDGLGVFFGIRTMASYIYESTSVGVWETYYDNLPYSILPDSQIRITGVHSEYTLYPYEEHTTEFTLIDDTLLIRHFYPNGSHEHYPANLGKAHLIRRNKNEK